MPVVRSNIGLPSDQSGGKKLDTAELAGSPPVERPIQALGSPSTDANIAEVVAAQPTTGTPGLVAYVVTTGAPAQEGTDGNTAPPVPTGGTGIRGWLASIYQKLAATLAVTQSGNWTVATTGADGSQATIGNTADASTATTLVGLLKAIKAFLAGTLTVGGTVTANAGTGTMAVGQATGSNLHVAVDALPALPAGGNALGTVGVTALPALPAGANAIGTVGVTALPALPAGANTIGGVTTIGSGTVIDDTATVTTTPAALPAHACNEVQVQNDPFSAADVYLGSATGQHTHIQPGMAQTLPATNSNLIYVKTLTGTATVNILGRS